MADASYSPPFDSRVTKPVERRVIRMPGSMADWGPAVPVCLALAIVHLVLVWGYVGQFWGDTGRWMHEINRFANGERLYLDFTWPFPPLAMWILGSAVKVVGTGVHQIWLVTSLVYFGIVALLLRYVYVVVPRDMVLVTAVASLLGAIAYAQVGGDPLPLGMYSPARAGWGVLFASRNGQLGGPGEWR